MIRLFLTTSNLFILTAEQTLHATTRRCCLDGNRKPRIILIFNLFRKNRRQACQNLLDGKNSAEHLPTSEISRFWSAVFNPPGQNNTDYSHNDEFDEDDIEF
jgi:hypothetical protein